MIGARASPSHQFAASGLDEAPPAEAPQQRPQDEAAKGAAVGHADVRDPSAVLVLQQAQHQGAAGRQGAELPDANDDLEEAGVAAHAAARDAAAEEGAVVVEVHDAALADLA